MGFLDKGAYGRLNGRVGNLVSYRLLDKEVIRIAGVNHTPPTIGQLGCRQEMRVVIAFLKPLIDFINIGFKLKAQEAVKYPHNMAVAYNKLHALKGKYPNIEMDYEKALVTQGALRPALNPQVELALVGLRFTWLCGDDLRWNDGRDRTMLLAYFPLSGKAVYSIGGAKRDAETDVLELPASLLHEEMKVYISFVAVGSSAVSDSVYVK